MMDFSQVKKIFNIKMRHGISIDIVKPLLDYYLELGNHEKLNNTQDYLIKPDNFTPPLLRDNGDLRQSLSYPLNWWKGSNQVNFENVLRSFNIKHYSKSQVVPNHQSPCHIMIVYIGG